MLVVPLHFFGSKSTISRFGERFRDDQLISTNWSFSYIYVCRSSTYGGPRAQPVVKVGARAPRAPWSRRHCL